MMRHIALCLMGVLALSACFAKDAPRQTRWDSYYARMDQPRAHVYVVPPEGTTVPMAKLIAEYVVAQLNKEKISAVYSPKVPSQVTSRAFVLTGVAEESQDPRVKYTRILRWMLSDTQGRVISTHAHGVAGSKSDWDFGSADVLNAIAIGTAGPVSQMVANETKTQTPLDPLQSGLMVERPTGVDVADAIALKNALSRALRNADVFVTGDPRQASFLVTSEIEQTPANDGFDDVRIVWRVLTMDRQEVGSAVQENRVPSGTLKANWREIVPSIATAAVVGVEHVFGVRGGPPPGSVLYPKGAPPPIVLPGQPGRALPPPQ